MVFGTFRRGLEKTRNRIAHAMRKLGGDYSDQERLGALEELLYTADVGPLATELLEQAESGIRQGDFADPHAMADWLRSSLAKKLQEVEAQPLRLADSGPTIVLVVGVNGSGKTTSVAKLAHWFQRQGKTPIVAAADTFRAAAVTQLQTWCDRMEVELVRGSETADPAAIVHDACDKALSSHADGLIIDTAGRLHTQKNLMGELEKVRRIATRKIAEAPHETLLVLDATTGQNALQQARLFGESVPLSGLILSKLDGTAKGGVVFSVGKELALPVKFVGLGEAKEDFEVFDRNRFVAALFESNA